MRTFICVTFYSRGENCDLQLYFPSEIATLKKTPHTEAYSNVWTQKGSASIFRMLECYVKSSILKVKVFGGEYWNKDHQITGKYHICAGGWSSISLKLQRNTSIEDKPWLKQVLHESLSLTHRFRVVKPYASIPCPSQGCDFLHCQRKIPKAIVKLYIQGPLTSPRNMLKTSFT